MPTGLTGQQDLVPEFSINVTALAGFETHVGGKYVELRDPANWQHCCGDW